VVGHHHRSQSKHQQPLSPLLPLVLAKWRGRGRLWSKSMSSSAVGTALQPSSLEKERGILLSLPFAAVVENGIMDTNVVVRNSPIDDAYLQALTTDGFFLRDSIL
jgi:hypothetical protein